MKYCFFLLGLYLSCANCVFAQSGNSTNDSTFLVWKSDTLKLIDSKCDHNRERFIRYYYNDSSIVCKELHLIDDDNGFLEIINYYRCYLKRTEVEFIKDDSISRILDMLKVNKEIPRGNFTLSFKNIISYYPSEIANQRYSFVEDIKDICIELDDGNKTINYEYVRGRLISKTETTNVIKEIR